MRAAGRTGTRSVGLDKYPRNRPAACWIACISGVGQGVESRTYLRTNLSAPGTVILEREAED